jgi:hypothetical protein
VPRTFDEYGKIVEAIPAGRLGTLHPFVLVDPWDHIAPPPQGHRLGSLADAVVPIDNTVGGAIWDWLHPAQRQAEYDLTGTIAPPVSAGDVVDIALQRTLDAAAAAKASFTQGFKYAGLAAAGIALIYVLRKTRK